jgi:hypothetical protein
VFIVRTIRNTQIYKKSVHTSQETHCVSATKPNRLILFRETDAVYCENHTEHTDTLCGQNAELQSLNPGGTDSHHWPSKGYGLNTGLREQVTAGGNERSPEKLHSAGRQKLYSSPDVTYGDGQTNDAEMGAEYSTNGEYEKYIKKY